MDFPELKSTVDFINKKEEEDGYDKLTGEVRGLFFNASDVPFVKVVVGEDEEAKLYDVELPMLSHDDGLIERMTEADKLAAIIAVEFEEGKDKILEEFHAEHREKYKAVYEKAMYGNKD